MNRRTLRDYTFKCVFHASFYQSGDLPAQLELFVDDFGTPDADLAEEGVTPVTALTAGEKQEILDRAGKVLSRLDEITQLISDKVEGWEPSRMNQVDLSIIRLAVYEMLYDDSVPERVAINEAVELARKYGGERSRKFVNGVLARFSSRENGKKPGENQETPGESAETPGGNPEKSGGSAETDAESAETSGENAEPSDVSGEQCDESGEQSGGSADPLPGSGELCGENAGADR
ncbi:MAG: transcription antitermination factor NusB [Lachnospiraceae bacterium]